MDDLTLEKAVKVCRAYEQSTKQVKGGMKSISTEGGVGGRVLLLREGFETD